jgi:hypothetical protein
VWILCEDKVPAKMPKEVMYYYLCQKFKSLPESGGLLDQDPVLLEAFLLCMNTESKHAAFEKQREEKKANKNKAKR